MQLLCRFHISVSVQIDTDKKQDTCWKAFYRAKIAFSSLDAKQVLSILQVEICNLYSFSYPTLRNITFNFLSI